MLSILFVIVGLHLLRTMQYIPFGVGPRVMAITKTMRDRDILPFYLVLTVMILIFSGGLQFAFGNEIIEYRYLSSSFETIFLAMFGDFNHLGPFVLWIIVVIEINQGIDELVSSIGVASDKLFQRSIEPGPLWVIQSPWC